MKYYFKAFANYGKCDGRATRKEYWLFILFHYIILFSLSILDAILGFYSTEIPLDYGYMTLVYLFASACPAICLQVRRLHDVGKSGYWWWLKNIPILSWYLFYLNCKASEPKINEYGYPSNYMPASASDDAEGVADLNKIRFCRKCGNKLIDGARFCNKCGTEVINEEE